MGQIKGEVPRCRHEGKAGLVSQAVLFCTATAAATAITRQSGIWMQLDGNISVCSQFGVGQQRKASPLASALRYRRADDTVAASH